jgi:zinc transport system substrate-binding protein
VKKLLLICLSALLLPMQSLSAAEKPQVVVSIKPIHSLVSGIMEGVATPALLVKTGSPHAYSLRPSEARSLANADLVIWVGHEMESFLEKPLETVANKSKQLTLSEKLQASLLTTRSGTEWDEHEDADHDEHDAADHDEHKDHDDDHEGHEHDETEHHDHEGHEVEEHHHGAMDLHIWLDPKIAQQIVTESTKALIEIDPAHTAQYQSNAAKLQEKLVLLDKQLIQKLAPVKQVPYLAFHSAYQYFETAYGLNAVGSVTIDPDRKPGAKGISEIRNRIKETGAKSVFSEPQFESSLVQTLIEDTGATTGILDPLGADLEQGPEAYFILLNNLADNLVKGLQ